MRQASAARGAGRSGYAIFRPRARLLKLIGAELISDEIVAITELVKNAHDADATTVTISFQGTATGDGRVVVVDDGCGMDIETVLGCWMEPAGSAKGDTRASDETLEHHVGGAGIAAVPAGHPVQPRRGGAGEGRHQAAQVVATERPLGAQDGDGRSGVVLEPSLHGGLQGSEFVGVHVGSSRVEHSREGARQSTNPVF